MAAGESLARRNPVAIALGASALLGLLYLFWQPATLDLSAQTFRADLWSREGWVLWNDAWYGGHTLPGYSLIYPPLGALLGPAIVGVLSSLAATACFALIATRCFGEWAWLGTLWLGLGVAAALYAGRITFALGLAIGLGALLAMQRERALLAAGGALLAGLASPVAGLFTGLAAAALVLAPRVRLPGGAEPREAGRGDVRPAAATLIGAALGVALMALAFPTPGYQPFAFSAWIWIPVVSAVLSFLAPADRPALRWGAILYAGLGIAAFALETPLGGNAVRLGTTFAGPLLALILLGRRNLLLLLLAAPLLWWQWSATVRDVAAATGDPSTEAAYYAPLIEELRARGDGPTRVEVPPTRNRWEAARLAPSVPIARGWLRQLEAEDFELFTDGRLDPIAYQQWLYEHGVGYVALADAEPDYLAEDEVALLEAGGLDYLREVYADEHWRLFEVLNSDGISPEPADALASGGARVTALGPDSYSVEVPGPGDYLLRVRYSSYLGIASGGPACIEDGGGPSTRLEVPSGARRTIEIRASLSLDGLLRRDRSCG